MSLWGIRLEQMTKRQMKREREREGERGGGASWLTMTMSDCQGDFRQKKSVKYLSSPPEGGV